MTKRILPIELRKLQHSATMSLIPFLCKDVLVRPNPNEEEWHDAVLIGIDTDRNQIGCKSGNATVWDSPLYLDGTPKIKTKK